MKLALLNIANSIWSHYSPVAVSTYEIHIVHSDMSNVYKRPTSIMKAVYEICTSHGFGKAKVVAVMEILFSGR